MFQNKVFLALGSNVGNWKVNFNHCLIEIQKIGQLTAIGNIYVSNPCGFRDQNNFYNTAIELNINFTPIQLIKKLKLIEKKLHKNKRFPNGPRRIDIDIIFFNSLQFNKDNLIIPHPRAKSRDFVIFPLCDIDPFFRHPLEKKSIKKLKKELQEKYIKKKITQPKDSFVIH